MKNNFIGCILKKICLYSVVNKKKCNDTSYIDCYGDIWFTYEHLCTVNDLKSGDLILYKTLYDGMEISCMGIVSEVYYHRKQNPVKIYIGANSDKRRELDVSYCPEPFLSYRYTTEEETKNFISNILKNNNYKKYLTDSNLSFIRNYTKYFDDDSLLKWSVNYIKNKNI